MAAYYPPVGFFFRVNVLGIPSHQHDVRFTEVSGLSRELGTEEVAEGGENRFAYKFPTRTKYPELVLKRGLLPESEILEWIRRAIEDFVFEPKDVDVHLLNEKQQPLLTWHLSGAFPTKWSISDFNSTSNTVVVESLQLYYQRFTLDKA